MRKTYLFMMFCLMYCATTASSQNKIVQLVNERGRDKMLKQKLQFMQATNEINRQKAFIWAEKHGWEKEITAPDGRIQSLQGLDTNGMPIYYATNSNIIAAKTIGTNNLWPNGLLNLNLTGNTPGIYGRLAIWDGGGVRASHQELIGRITQLDTPSQLSDHSTHVAGTMIASGMYPDARGMAYKTETLKAWDFDNDTKEMAEAASGLLVSNHSYGTISGWKYNSSRAGTATDPYWEWRGDVNVSETEDYKFGYYDSRASDYDLIAYSAPYYLIVKSAGNNRNENGPAVNSPYLRINSSGTAWELKNRVAEIKSNNTYDIISTFGNAKNILTVGAVNALPDGYQQPSDVKISTFSSYGPTDDGRIKPEVVANGVGLVSSISTGDGNYGNYSGTSMAAPNASGSLFLLQELYFKKNGSFMLSSTLKGLVCHTADDAGTVGPDYTYGFGLINTTKAANAITKSNHLISEFILTQSETKTLDVFASGNGKLMFTICWTDPQIDPLPINKSVLNNRTPRLVNDIDISVSDGAQTFLPWILNVENPSEAAKTGINSIDNIEQVLLNNAFPGKKYTITITHKGQLSGGQQIISLIGSGIGEKEMCGSMANQTENSKLNKLTVKNLSKIFDPASCSNYKDLTSEPIMVYAGEEMNYDLEAGTCGTENNRFVKIFADWNNNQEFDSDEEIAQSNLISTTGNFTGKISIPYAVKAGNNHRLRLVLQETSNPDDIKACGNYEYGETIDMLLSISEPAIDLVAKSINLSELHNFNTSAVYTTINFSNNGSEPVASVDFEAIIYEDNVKIATINETLLESIAGKKHSFYRFNQPFTTKGNKTYKIECKIITTSDSDPNNNRIETEFTTTGLEVAPIVYATTCGTQNNVSLKSESSDPTYWYDAPDGILIAVGNLLTLNKAKIPDTNKLYAQTNKFKGQLGPKTKSEAPYTAGTYARTTSTPYFEVLTPVIIRSARLYVGNAGTVTFSVTNINSGKVVSTKTIRVAATRTPASTSTSAPNDPTDQGQVHQLDLTIPESGNYLIDIAYDQATLFRANAITTGSAPYPYQIADVIKLTGTSAGDKYYYWLYDMQIEALGCPSGITEVPLQQQSDAQIAIEGDNNIVLCHKDPYLLNATQIPNTSYLWFNGTTPLPGNTLPTITTTEAGVYKVLATTETGCAWYSTNEVTINRPTNPIPTPEILPSASTLVCEGNSVNINLQASTGLIDDIFYSWFSNGTELNGANQWSYQPTQPGQYWVKAFNQCNEITSQPIDVIVATPTLSTATANICEGEIAPLKATSTHGTVFWYDAPINGNLLQVGYDYNTKPIATSTSVYAGINDFSGNLPSPSNTLKGSFSSFSSGRMYFDSQVPLMIEKATINVQTAGKMTVIITDKNSNLIINSITIDVIPGINEYNLNLNIPIPGNNYGLQVSKFTDGATAFRNNSAGSATFPYEIPGIFKLTGTNQTSQSSFYYYLYNIGIKSIGCQATRQEVTITAHPLPTVDAGKDQVICKGSDATLDASYDNGTLKWDNNVINKTPFKPEATSTFIATVTSPGGCSVSDDVTIQVNPSPIVEIQFKKNEDGSYILDAGETFTSYLWSNGATTSSINVNATGKYHVTVTNQFDCSAYCEYEILSTGLNDEKQNGKTLIYPNPAQNEVTVEHSTPFNFKLVNLEGQIVRQTLEFIKTHQINVNDIPLGTYIIQITEKEKGVIKSFKLVKK